MSGGRVRQALRESVARSRSPATSQRGEALPVHVGGLQLAVRALGRAGAAPTKPLRGQALPVRGVRQEVRALRPPRQARPRARAPRGRRRRRCQESLTLLSNKKTVLNL